MITFRSSDCYNYDPEEVVQYLVSWSNRNRIDKTSSEQNCLDDSRICGSGLRPRVYPSRTDVPRDRRADRNEDANDRESGKILRLL